MLSDIDQKIFSDTGILAVRGLVSRALTTQVKDLIDSELSRLKYRVNGKYTSSKLQEMPIFQQSGYLSGQVQVGTELEKLFTSELFKLMTELSESNLKPAHPHPQLLLSLPNKEEWSLKNLNWHLDYKNSRMDILPGIQPFVLIDDLLSQGGATLALAGSHRLHKVKLGQNAHGVLRENRGFNENPEKFLEPQPIFDVPVRIVEMSGKAGDVFLMDLRVLHTPSVNSQRRPRMMTTNRFLKPGLKL